MYNIKSALSTFCPAHYQQPIKGPPPPRHAYVYPFSPSPPVRHPYLGFPTPEVPSYLRSYLEERREILLAYDTPPLDDTPGPKFASTPLRYPRTPPPAVPYPFTPISEHEKWVLYCHLQCVQCTDLRTLCGCVHCVGTLCGYLYSYILWVHFVDIFTRLCSLFLCVSLPPSLPPSTHPWIYTKSVFLVHTCTCTYTLLIQHYKTSKTYLNSLPSLSPFPPVLVKKISRWRQEQNRPSLLLTWIQQD